MAAKDLIAIIWENPGCIATIDNDHWKLERSAERPDGFDHWTDEAQDEWFAQLTIASSDDEFTEPRYNDPIEGRGLMQALADLVGITVELA